MELQSGVCEKPKNELFIVKKNSIKNKRFTLQDLNKDMKPNVWVKLGIYAVLMCGGQNPGFWFVRPRDGSPDMYTYWEGKAWPESRT